MKTFSFTILGNRELNLGEIFNEYLPEYSLLHRNGTSILVTDVLKLRTSSTMLNVIVLSTKDGRNYVVDLIAGGGKEGVLIQLDWWSESSELKKMKERIEEICDKNNLTLMEPGDSYY